MTPPASQDGSSPVNPQDRRRTLPKNHLVNDLRVAWEADLIKATGLTSLEPTASGHPSPFGQMTLSDLPRRKQSRVLLLLHRRAEMEEWVTTQSQRTSFARWISTASKERPAQTISGRPDDPRRLPSAFPLIQGRRTALYEFKLPRSSSLQAGDSLQVGIDGAHHHAIVHSVAHGRVTLAFAHINLRSIADASLVQEKPCQLGSGTRVTNRYRYVFATPSHIPLAPGTPIEFTDAGARCRGHVVDSKEKFIVVETDTKLSHKSPPTTLQERRYWEDYYVRVRDLRHRTFGRKFTTTVINELWNSYPDSRAAKFMRAFSHPDNYAFPHLTAEGKLPPFFTRGFFDRCSLVPYLVSPDLLPSKLSSDLKLVTWPPERLCAAQVLKIKSEAHVIEGVKMIFEASRWLSEEQSGMRRMLVVQAATEQMHARYPSANPIDPSIVGSILYLRETVPGGQPPAAGSEFNPEPITVQFYSSAYAARRRNPHATVGYTDEVSRQSAFRLAARDLNDRLSRDWNNSAAAKAALTAELNEFVDHWSAQFEGSEHRLKRELSRFLQDIEERIPFIAQRLGPIQAKLVGAQNRSTDRGKEIPRIQGTMAADNSLLDDEIAKGERTIDTIRSSLITASAKLELEERDLFDTRRTPLEQAHVVSEFLRGARLNFQPLDDLRVRPFCTFAQKLRSTYEEFNGSLLRRDRECAKDALVKLLVVTKLARTNAVLEELKFKVSFDKDLTLEQLVKTATDLETLIADRTVLPNRVVESYRHAYEATEKEVRDLVKGFTYYRKKGLDLEARKQKYRDIRAFLDKIDLEDRVRSLS